MLSLEPVLNLLSGSHEDVPNWLHMLALSSIRVSVMFIILPATSSQVLPGLARGGIVALLSGFIAAGQTPGAFDDISAATLFMLSVKEAFIGLVIGYAVSTLFWTAEAAGALIDNLAGFNNVQMANPMQDEQNTPVSSVLLQLAITLFYISGGMTMVLGALFDSYRWWPLDFVLPPSELAVGASLMDFLINQGGSILSTSIKLCTPVLLVLVLIDVGLGVLGRAADKLEPTSLSQPVRGVVGVLLLVALATAIASQVRETVSMRGFSQVLSGLLVKPEVGVKPN